MSKPLPAASRLHLPRGPWHTVLECLCARFPAIAEDVWRSRMQRGLVQDLAGQDRPPGIPIGLAMAEAQPEQPGARRVWILTLWM